MKEKTKDEDIERVYPTPLSQKGCDTISVLSVLRQV